MEAPSGVICLWYGAIIDIPVGWVICDGTAGTPDLRDKFIVGAGDTYAVAAVGGAVNHDHNFTTNGHNHTVVAGLSLGVGANFSASVTTETDTGTTNATDHLPPYHALAYIMKS